MEKRPKFYSLRQFQKIVKDQEKFILNRCDDFVKLVNDVTAEYFEIINFINYAEIYTAIKNDYFLFAKFTTILKIDVSGKTIGNDLYHELASCLDTYHSESRINFFDHMYHPERDEELKQKIKDAFEKCLTKVKDKDKLIENALKKLTDEEKIALGLMNSAIIHIRP